MFYIHEIGGRVAPYQAGVLRAKHVAEPAAPVSPIEGHAASPQSNAATNQSAAAAPVLAAYEKSVHPDTPCRRLIFSGELMSKELVTINANALLSAAAEIFLHRSFRHLPVLDTENHLVGILSDRDLLRSSSRKGWEDETVGSIATQSLLVASGDTEIREVAGVMIDVHVGCMPIINKEANLVGIVTRSDILRTLLVQAPLELWS